MSEEKLLPCPFCGDEPELHWINEAGEVLTAWVRCKCGCEHHERLTREVAVKKWNSRHLPNDAQGVPESDGYRAAWLELMEHCNKLKEENFNLRSAAQTSWHSMDTAPKDGTEILGWWRRSEAHTIIAWSNDSWWKDSADDNMVSAPTHWQYLQDGPSVSSAGNAAQGSRDRHTAIETAIRSYCRRQSSAAVQNGRIYYAGLSITDLVNDIEAALTTSGGDVAAEAPEPPLARLLKEVDPGLANVLTDNAAYVRVIRNNVIRECARHAEGLAEKPGWSPGYARAASVIADSIRKLAESNEDGCVVAEVPEIDRLRAVFEAAYGLCCGYDWNCGTAAIAAGYRRKLLSAVNAIKEVPDFDGKYRDYGPSLSSADRGGAA